MRHREGRSYDADIWVRLTPLLEYNPIFTNFRLTSSHATAASKFGGIVADDVGLGKTRTVVAHIRLQRNGDSAPTLIVTPLNVLDQWLFELKEQGVPHKEVYGTRRPHAIRNDDVQAIVTTFHTVMHDRNRQGGGILSRVQWQRIVLDESHRLSGASLCASLSSLHGNTRWAISATPGKSSDCLIRQLKWIGLDFPMTPLVAQQVLFRGWYDESSTESYSRPPFECVFLTMLLRYVARRRAQDDTESAAEGRVNVVLDHRAVPRDAVQGDYDCALRATRARIEYSTSGAMVSRFFEQLREQLSRGIFDGRSEFGDIFASVRATATVEDGATPSAAREGCCPICYEAKPIHLYIRTPCDHDICAACAAALLQATATRSSGQVPSVLHGACPMCRAPFDNKNVRLLAAPPPQPTDSTATRTIADATTGKMRALLHFVNEEPREKVVVFTEFASTLKHAQECLRANAPDVRVMFINGAMTRAQRVRALRAFRALDPHDGPVVFLLTTRSSSCGVNLQCATRILFLEPTVDATARHQAIGRLKRYGQEAHEIRVATLFTSGTVEEKLMPYTVDTDVEWHSTKYNVMAILD